MYKEGNLATPTGEQAPVNTPEANKGTVSNNSIHTKEEFVNAKSTQNFEKFYVPKERKLVNYTESEYNHYGWAVANDVISIKEMAAFCRKIAEKRTGTFFEKSLSGKYIIPVGEQFGVENVLVFTDGNYNSPSIEKVVRIDLDDATEIEFIKEFVYNGNFEDALQDGVSEKMYGKKLIRRSSPSDYRGSGAYRRGRSSGERSNGSKINQNNRIESDRGRNSQESQRSEITFDESYSIPSETASLCDK